MTQPDPGSAPGAPAVPAPPAVSVAPVQGLDPNAPVDITSLPVNVQKMIADLRNENGKHRQGRTAAETAAADAISQKANVLKALGLNPDGSTADDDPKTAITALNTRATAAEQRAAAAEERVWASDTKALLREVAPELGSNAKALLNNVEFLDSLDDLVDEDPDDPTFRTALEAKIRDAVRNDPTLRATSAPARMGTDITGSGGGGRQRPTSLGAAIAAATSK